MPFISLSAVPASIPVAESFFTRWMPAASGSYVKVYLHLLYLSAKGGESFSSRQAADRLYMSESEVLEAIRYWEEKGLLNVQKTAEKVSLSLCPPSREVPETVPESIASSVITVREDSSGRTSVPADPLPSTPADDAADRESGDASVKTEAAEPAMQAASPVVVEARPSYSPSELAVYSRDPFPARLRAQGLSAQPELAVGALQPV